MSRPVRFTVIIFLAALGTALAAMGGWRYARASAPLAGPIVLISIDTLRADHLPAYGYHGDRVLAYLTTGVIPTPTTVRGDGGGALKQGWFGGRRLFGSNTPASVVTLTGRPEVIGYPSAGANHMVAEQFADHP